MGMNNIRTIFLSDLHIGHRSFDIGGVVDFLRNNDARIIYLVGDIIDGWKLKKRWYWRHSYTVLIDLLVEKQKQGAKIIYLTGNHDEEVRYLSPIRRALFAERLKIRVSNFAIHKTADKRRLIVMHGDQFDNILLRGRISRWSAAFYEMMGTLFGLYGRAPKVRVDGRLRPFSLAKALVKRSGKTTLKLLNNFERASSRLVRSKKADGIICGHTHMPKLKVLPNGTVFGNCGMWTGQKNTAIVEYEDGRLDLLDLPAGDGVNDYEDIPIQNAEETAVIIRTLRQIWQSDKLTPWLTFVDALDRRIALSKPEKGRLPYRSESLS